jgi:hypothetical protein
MMMEATGEKHDVQRRMRRLRRRRGTPVPL